MQEIEVRSITVAIRLSPSTFKELRRIAAQDNRTVSYLLDKLAKKHIKENPREVIIPNK